MSLTFPANYQAAIKSGYLKNAQWIILVKYNNQVTASHYFWTGDVNKIVSGLSLGTAIIANVSDITSSINPFDSSYSVSNMTFSLAETVGVGSNPNSIPTAAQRTTADFLSFVSREYVNREVIVYQYVDDARVTSISDLPIVFKGVILSIRQNVATSSYDFTCVSKWDIAHKDIPSTIITKTDYPKTKEQYIGKRLPIVYGSFQQYASDLRDHMSGIFNLAPLILTDATSGTFTLAGHACKSFNSQDACMYLSDLDTYGGGILDESSNYGTTSVAGPTTFTLPIGSGTQYLQLGILWLRPKQKGASNFVSDITNIVDDLHSSSTSIAGLTAMYLKFDSLNGSGTFRNPPSSSSGVMQIAMHIASYSPGSANWQARVYNPILPGTYDAGSASTGTGQQLKDFQNSTQRSDYEGNAIATTAQWSWEELAAYEFGISIPASNTLALSWFGITVSNVIINSAAAEILTKVSRTKTDMITNLNPFSFEGTYEPKWGSRGVVYTQRARYASFKNGINESLSNLFCECEGRMFGSWIDEGARSGSATSYNSGDLITKSQYIIESILRDEVGVTSSDIDDDSFDGLDSANQYTMAFSINEPTDTRDLIRQVGYCSRSIVYPTTEGKWHLFSYPDDPATTFASSYIPLDAGDVLFKEFYWSGQDSLFNSVVIHYAYDYGRGYYVKDYKVSDSTSQGTTYQGYNRTNEIAIECPYIRYDSSGGTNYAASLGDYVLANWKDKHLMADFDLINMRYSYLTEGDVIGFVNVNTSIGGVNPFGIFTGSSTNVMMGAPASPRTIFFVITTCQRSLNKCSYTAMNLHSL